jgi:hypothetical protein
MIVSTAALALSMSRVHALPPELTSFLSSETNSVTEDGFLPSRMPASMDFARAVVANWQEVLNSIETLAPDLRRQALIVVAAEFLPPKDYVQFVNRVSDLKPAGQVTVEALHFVLWARMAKDGFLAFNHDQSNVANAISKLERNVMANAPNDWRDFFSDLKSGKMKLRVVAKRTREGDKLPESMSVVESEPYRRLMGGSVKQDVKLVATQPVEAVTSLASVNRERWSMIVAISLVLVVSCLIGIAFRIWKRSRK